MSLAFTLYWFGICPLAGAIIYSEMLDRGPPDDPFGDRADGDWPSIPEDLKTVFHDSGSN